MQEEKAKAAELVKEKGTEVQIEFHLTHPINHLVTHLIVHRAIHLTAEKQSG